MNRAFSVTSRPSALGAPSPFDFGARQVEPPFGVVGAFELGIDEAVDGLVADDLAAFLTLWMGLLPGRVLVWGDNVAKQLLPAVAAAPSEAAAAAPADAAPSAPPSEAPKAIEVVPLPNPELPR